MRRHHTTGKRCSDDFSFGAHQQVVFKLTRRTHGGSGDGTVMARDKVHQSEIKHLHIGQGGKPLRIAQCTVCFDQDVDWNRAINGGLF